VDNQLKAVRQQCLQHQVGNSRRCAIGHFGDYIEKVRVQPGRATRNSVLENAIGGLDEIERGGVPVYILSVTDYATDVLWEDAARGSADMNVCYFEFRLLSKNGYDCQQRERSKPVHILDLQNSVSTVPGTDLPSLSRSHRNCNGSGCIPANRSAVVA
jgi:hypothetical protein